MENKWIKVGMGEVEAEFYDKNDMKKVIELYNSWIKINGLSKDLKGRQFNSPEAVSEVLTSYIFELGRTNSAKTKGSIGGASMDALSKDGRKVQIKAGMIEGGTVTSFSPSTNYDDLYYVDFFANGLWDGEIHIYKVKPFDGSKIMVNATESFNDQQDQKRRPRFNLMKKMIDGEVEILEKRVIKLKDFLDEK